MKTSRTYKCTHKGCLESQYREYDSTKEAREDIGRRSQWKCTRHSYPEDLLTTDSRIKTRILINRMVKAESGNELGLFFDGHYGFVSGNGFKAFAKDFPDGTRLKITAEITLP